VSRVWEVVPDADRYLCVQQADLRLFNGRFIGKPMSRDWTSPEFETLNRSKKVADFTSWQMGSRAMLVTVRAKDAIESLAGTDVEFLPFATIRGVELLALNVLRLVPAVDWEAMNRQDWNLSTPVILRSGLADIPPIFKDSERPHSTFASDALGELALEYGLKGLRLADPRKNLTRSIVRGLEINEYPGL